MKILITCPNMVRTIKNYDKKFNEYGFDYYCPKISQTMTEEELLSIIADYDGWIIGDDPATRRVFEKGNSGKLKAAVKWGVGTDNVDFEACKELNIPISNTPQMFGEEVSDVALGYLLCLNRNLHEINNECRQGIWFKPLGKSLIGKKACLIGLGDIGRCIARKLLAFNINVFACDPGYEKINGSIVNKNDKTMELPFYLKNITLTNLNLSLTDSDFIIVACPLNKQTQYLIQKEQILKAKKGVIIINVGRGGIVKESDVYDLQKEGFINSIGFDVFEKEPLDINHPLKEFSKNMFGTHNGSNSAEGVNRVSLICIEKMYDYLKDYES